MAKRPNPLTDRDQSRAVYSRTIQMTRNAGDTQSSLTPTLIPVQNVTTLESHIQRDQICTDPRYDWKTGKTTMEPQDVMESAQRNISRLKLSQPATMGIRQQREREVAKKVGNGGNDNCCAPCGYYGQPGSPVPLQGGMKRKREY